MMYLYIAAKFWREVLIGLLVFLCLVIAAFANHHAGKVKKLEIQHQAEILKSKAAYNQAKADAAEKEKIWSNQLLKAEQNYNAKFKQITTDAAIAKSNADSLSKQLDTAKKRLPTATTKTIIEYVDTSSDVLKECITEYRTMAEIADGHAIDARRLSDAWLE